MLLLESKSISRSILLDGLGTEKVALNSDAMDSKKFSDDFMNN